MDFKGQVTVITGTSSGLGRRFALDMAAQGATVIGLARRAELLESLRIRMQADSPSSSTVVCDVTAVEAFTGLLGQIEEEHVDATSHRPRGKGPQTRERRGGEGPQGRRCPPTGHHRPDRPDNARVGRSPRPVGHHRHLLPVPA